MAQVPMEHKKTGAKSTAPSEDAFEYAWKPVGWTRIKASKPDKTTKETR